jgi:hypothetical protein
MKKKLNFDFMDRQENFVLCVLKKSAKRVDAEASSDNLRLFFL